LNQLYNIIIEELLYTLYSLYNKIFMTLLRSVVLQAYTVVAKYKDVYTLKKNPDHIEKKLC